MPKFKKMLWIILGLIGLVTLIQTSTVLGIEYSQAKENAKQLNAFDINPNAAKTLVAYFSRSGNTELMAYKIAEVTNGNILNIQSPDYKLGLKGWIQAMVDARKMRAVLATKKFDLSTYDTIYVGSPIWLYSPAPPVFEFVRNNDFTGKTVILFNSLNSKFEQKYIDQFSDLVNAQGGRVIKHIYVIRGRMTRQLDVEDFLREVAKENKID